MSQFLKIIFAMQKYNSGEDGHWNRTKIQNTSKAAKKYLSDHRVNVMECLSNSPDLNPIENLWSIIKRCVEKRKPKNLQELDTFLHKEWHNIHTEIITNFFRSIKSRLNAVIESNGERIDY